MRRMPPTVNGNQDSNNIGQQHTHHGPSTGLSMSGFLPMVLALFDDQQETPYPPTFTNTASILSDIPDQIQSPTVPANNLWPPLPTSWFDELKNLVLQLLVLVEQPMDLEPEHSEPRQYADRTWDSLSAAHDSLKAWQESKLPVYEVIDPATGNAGQFPPTPIAPVTFHGGQQILDLEQDNLPANYCKSCKKIINTQFNRHMRQVHPGPDTILYQCSKCNARFPRLDNFKRHAKHSDHNSTPVLRKGL
ncbi:uncharacterized protein PG998_010105 [Apiospora kogelbergensis]|uniref:uncharacterized protein n=1 Tax=Apiospora kogelbergensis TaxID=1337665 RepID=UPI003131F919